MYACVNMCIYVCTCSLDCSWSFFPLQPCPLKPSFETEASRANPHTGPCPSPSSALLEASWLQQTRLPPTAERPGHTAPMSAGEASGPLPPDRRFTVYNLACVKHLSAGSSSLGRPPRQRACRKRLRARSQLEAGCGPTRLSCTGDFFGIISSASLLQTQPCLHGAIPAC